MRLIELSGFRRIAAFRSSELALALATMAGVLLDVLYGVLVAIGLSILDLPRRLARPHDGILGEVPGVAGMHDVDDYPHATRAHRARHRVRNGQGQAAKHSGAS